MTAGGKGHAPRQQRDDKAYSEGWDRIFNKKDLEQCENKGKCAEPFCSCEVKNEHKTSS